MNPREALAAIISRRRAGYERELAASKLYEELRRLSADELIIEALLNGVDPSRLSRQQLTAEIIETKLR